MDWTDAAREIDAAYDIPELAGMAEAIARDTGSDVVDEAHMAAALARHARHVAGDTSPGTALMIDQDTPDRN